MRYVGILYSMYVRKSNKLHCTNKSSLAIRNNLLRMSSYSVFISPDKQQAASVPEISMTDVVNILYQRFHAMPVRLITLLLRGE